jgi:hypothetical protein
MVSVKRTTPDRKAKTLFKGKDWLLIPSLICLLMVLFAFKIYANIKNTRYKTALPAVPSPTSITPVVSPKANSATAIPAPKATITIKPSVGRGGCIVGGCNGEICSDKEMASPCIYKPEFECYRNAVCEKQSDGSCGWTSTAELTACLGASI